MAKYIIQEDKLTNVIQEVSDEVINIAAKIDQAIDELNTAIDLDDVQDIRNAVADVVYDLKELYDGIE